MSRRSSKTIVVKVGSTTLTREDGVLDETFIDDLVGQLCDLRDSGHPVVLVTSGAIRSGMAWLALGETRTVPEKQAAAAVGQSLLMQTYGDAFARRNVKVAQVLLTRDDISQRRRFLNARNTLAQLSRWDVVPIVNENDTVVVEEIRFGDNDTLAARAAILVGADLLVLLSDVEGLYLPEADDPVRIVKAITPAVRSAARRSGTAAGTGGMITKLEAADIATQSGVSMVIARGRRPGVLRDIAAGKLVGTLFPAEHQLTSRKRWIAFGPQIRGKVQVNEGCRTSLTKRGRSLLLVGMTAVHGRFSRGDLVAIVDEQGNEFARGLVNYTSAEAQRLVGRRSNEIAAELGSKDFDEVIHRDNLVISDAGRE